jgi:predicted Na+-dependent transporter
MKIIIGIISIVFLETIAIIKGIDGRTLAIAMFLIGLLIDPKAIINFFKNKKRKK